MSSNPGTETLDGDSPPIDRDVVSMGEETQLGEHSEPIDELAPPGYDDEPTQIGRYLILRRIGEGGMGVVYAAYDNELDRRVAIKLVHGRTGSNYRARVRREAQALARLSHPNVVQVYEVAEFERQIYVVMEFVVGPTLAEWTRAQSSSPTRWRTILSKYIDVGRGLAAAHQVQLVHRDFKPANAIVGDDGRVRVLDFGIARASEGPRSRSSQNADDEDARPNTGEDVDLFATPLTRTGALVGTPAYMSPEQFERGNIDARSDQFSFCVALYEALYGERPFVGDTAATLLVNVLAGKLRPPPPRVEVPAWVREVVVRGLASDPNERWASMQALLDALEADPDRRRRRRLRLLLGASATLAAVLGSVWFGRVQMRERSEAEAEAAAARELEALAAAREAEAEAERDRALRDAQAAAMRARDTARVLAARAQRSHPEIAAALLRDAEQPAEVPGWRSAAIGALQQPMTRELFDDHEDRVVYLDVSLDGRWVVSASLDGSARVWSSKGGKPLLLRHDDGLYMAAFDRAATQVVVASRDGIAKVWRLPEPNADGSPGSALAEPIVLRGATQVLWSAQFSFDGSKVVTGSRDGKARVYTLAQPDTPLVLDAGVDAYVWWAEFSPNGRFVVTGGSDGRALVWSLEQPERPPLELRGHSASVGDVHWSPTMPIIATASADGSARLYRFTGQEQGPLDAYAVLTHEKAVHRVRFALDGMRLVTSSRDDTARVWTLGRDGALVGEAQVFTAPDGKHVWSSDFSYDGMLLAMGRGDGIVQVQPLRGGPKLLLRGHTSEVFWVRFSPDHRTLYSASFDGTVRAWSTELHTAARDLDDRFTDFIVRGRVLASATMHGSVKVWNVEDPGLAAAVSEKPAEITGHEGRVYIALDAFPRVLASADEKLSRIRLWRITGTLVLDTQRPLATLSPPAPVEWMNFDPEGGRLVASLLDGELMTWSLEQPTPSGRVLRRHQPGGTSATPMFSPDGQHLAAAGDTFAIELWQRDELDAASAIEPAQLLGHSARLRTLRFSNDSRKLVSAGNDHSARVWDLALAPAQQRPLVLEHPYYVYTAVFDPAGERVLTACGDTNAYLWTLADPSQPTVLRGATGEVRDVAFSPDGRRLAAASTDGSVRVWSSEGGEPIELFADASLGHVEFVDGGRRLATQGYGSTIWLWHLGADLEVMELQRRLREATQVCLDPTQRTRFIGEAIHEASKSYQACQLASGR